jgi:phosphatidylinositol alpha-1,6-mannosyltransferase
MPKRSLRVLALVTDAFGAGGGIAQYNRDFLSSLGACDRVSEVVVLPRHGRASAHSLPAGVKQLPPVEGKIGYSFAAFRAAISKPVDLLFCGHLYMVPLAAAVAKFLRIPLWVQVHGVEAWTELSALHRRSVETAILVSSVSRYTRRRLLEWVPIDPGRVKVLPNTVSPKFYPAPKLARLLGQHKAWGKKIALTVSRLASSERYKGHDRIIKILPRVLAEHSQTIYLVVGDGDDRSRLEALAKEVGVDAHVHFTGFVDFEDLPNYYRIADVFVMPSTGEGFGIAFLEAAASGIRVIGGNQDGSVDPLVDGALGTVIDPTDGNALTSAICTALSNDAASTKQDNRFNFELFNQQLHALVSSFFAAPA